MSQQILLIFMRFYYNSASMELLQILIRTIKRSAPDVLRFLLCAFVFYFGFAICGWVVLGPYHIKVSCTDFSDNLNQLFLTFNVVFVFALLPPTTRRRLCDSHSFCHSVNGITDERGNGRRPNLAGIGKG